jgi:S1-C subfamily serine protease
MIIFKLFFRGLFFGWVYFISIGLVAADSGIDALPDTILKVKPGIVGIGTFQETRRPPGVLRGTGFVVADGHHVVTNAHVLPEKLDKKHNEFIAVFTGQGKEGRILSAETIGTENDHDLCLLRFGGKALPPLVLGDDSLVREGELYAFTGYPLGAILGLYAATHRGIVSAVTPIVIPVTAMKQLDGELIGRLKNPYLIFQLDATAYPGNSGSPLYDVKSGRVIGIINKVFVQGAKEHAITNPSGMTYAIPVRYLKKFMKGLGIESR